MLFGDGAGAVVLGPTAVRRRHRPDRRSPPTAASADTIVATPRGPRASAWTAISTFKIAVKRLTESTVDAVAARRPRARRHRPVRLPPGQRAASSARSASGSTSTRRKVADYIAQLGNTSRRLDPARRSRSAREDGRLRPGHKVLVAAIGAGFTWGAGVDGVGGIVSSRPDNATALVTGASKGIGAAIAQRARRRRLERRASTTAPTRTAPSATVKAIEEAGGKAVAIHGDVSNGGVARRCSSRLEDELGPVLALVNNAGVAARRPRDPARRRRLGRGHRHQPDRRLPPDARRAARDDQGALRARRQHRLGRRPARQRRAVQLRRGQGRPDRHDQDRSPPRSRGAA